MDAYICVKDEEGRFVYANDLDASLYNSTSSGLLGKTVEPFVGRTQFLKWLEDDKAVIRSGRTKHLPPYSRIDASGDIHWFESVLTPFRDEVTARNLLLVVHRDITAIKRAEIELQQQQQKDANSEKTDLISLLSSNFAHDFNNIIAIILNSAKAINDVSNVDALLKQSSDTIIETCTRASTIVSKFLLLSGNELWKPECFDLNQSLRSQESHWSTTVGKCVSILFELTGQSSMIYGSASQVNQMVKQLILNAHEAIPGTGTIRIRTELRSDVHGPDSIILTVSDNGKGMSEATLPKIFNPLYTTKSIEQGGGLGLALVESVVKKHHAKIRIHSTLGAGTSVTIEFPTATAQNALPTSNHSGNKPGDLSRKTILLVDDESLLRNLFSKFIEKQGAVVVTAASGDEAWDWLLANSFRIDALVTDIVMPGTIDGVSLRRKLFAQSPDIPSVIISGHSFHFLSEDEPLPENTKLLQKPFSGKVLTETLNGLFSN